MNDRYLLAIVLGLGGSFLGTSCSETSQPASGYAMFVRNAKTGEPLELPEGFVGVSIDIAPSLSYQQTMVMASGAETQRSTRIEGHEFAIDGDHIVIGPKRYGPLPAGSHVEIDERGVFLGDTLLGPLPEPIPTESASE